MSETQSLIPALYQQDVVIVIQTCNPRSREEEKKGRQTRSPTHTGLNRDEVFLLGLSTQRSIDFSEGTKRTAATPEPDGRLPLGGA